MGLAASHLMVKIALPPAGSIFMGTNPPVKLGPGTQDAQEEPLFELP